MPKHTMLSVQATPDTAAIRTAELFGDEHTVVPCVALVEGVLWPANAPAPELALAEEFGRFPEGWNGRPVVFDHPKENGAAVSANSPSVLEAVSIGELFNTTVVDGKLKTEIWINNVRIKTMSDDVQEAVDRLKDGDQTVEVSTGLFTLSEIASGEFEGEEFEAIWRNIVPDHLAILPEGITGACSVADGCGAPRTNVMKPVMRAAQMHTNTGNDIITTSDGTCDCEPGDEKKGIFQKIMEKAGDILGIVNNGKDLSDNDTRTAIQSALGNTESYFWIMAVYDDGDGSGIVVYESFDNGKIYERDYSIKDSSVTIGADKFEVRPVTQFVRVTPDGDVTDNSEGATNTETPDGSIQENSTMNKDQLVQGLIDNASTQFTEDDRDMLTALEENVLVKMSPIGAPVVDEVIEEIIPDADVVIENAAPKAVSTDEYIAAAPDEVRQVLNSGLKMHRSRKDALIKGILENARCTFTQEQLDVKPIDELESLASLATDIDFSVNGGHLVDNSTDDDAPPTPLAIFPDLEKSA